MRSGDPIRRVALASVGTFPHSRAKICNDTRQKCAICGKTNPLLDHCVPLSRSSAICGHSLYRRRFLRQDLAGASQQRSLLRSRFRLPSAKARLHDPCVCMGECVLRLEYSLNSRSPAGSLRRQELPKSARAERSAHASKFAGARSRLPMSSSSMSAETGCHFTHRACPTLEILGDM